MPNNHLHLHNFKHNFEKIGKDNNSDTMDLQPYPNTSSEDFHNHLKHLNFLQQKIIHSLKKYDIDDSLIAILARFFDLEEETFPFLLPSASMLEYHSTLTNEIYRVMHDKNAENIFSELFLLFLKFNFNKYSICSYYSEIIEELKAKKDQSEKVFFYLANYVHSHIEIHYSYSLSHSSLSLAVILSCKTQLEPK